MNKVMLIGYVGSDPEVKDVNGAKLARFSIATSEQWKDKESGEKKEHTEWHNISAWGSLAGTVEKHVHKGSHLFVEGEIRNRSYVDESGKKRYITEVRADRVIFLDKKRDGDGAAQTEEDIPF